MRVLTFTSLFPNAVQPTHGIFIYQRTAALVSKQDNSVEVIAPVPYLPGWIPSKRLEKTAEVPSEERMGEIPVHHPRYLLVPKVSMPLHGWLMYQGSKRIARRLHKIAPFDCIDAHYIYPDGFAAILLGKELQLPVFLSARGTDLNLFPSFRTIQPKIRWALGRAAGIITVSAALRDAVINLGVSPDGVTVISNGIDPRRFCPRDRREARRALNLPQETKIVVSVGTLVEHKGFLNLVRATARLAPRVPHLNLYIIGEGTLRKEIIQHAKNLGLESRVHLVGSCKNELLPLWYNAADVTCLASTREGLPNVVLESLACGTPVVATRVGGIPEVITSKKLGLLVDPTPESLAEGLGAALSATWDREELARAGDSRTWTMVANEVERYFKSRLRR